MMTLEQLVQDKSVALVGSAQSLLGERLAQQIDAHDIVIRMNLSVPNGHNRKSVGNKTDVWCAARAFVHERTPADTKHILFMKLTKLGDKEWPLIKRRPVDTTRWPATYEEEVLKFVGSPPGTGIRMLYWLKRIAHPKSVAVFGMDCWDTLSSWSGKPASAHNPALEKIAMESLLRR